MAQISITTSQVNCKNFVFKQASSICKKRSRQNILFIVIFGKAAYHIENMPFLVSIADSKLRPFQIKLAVLISVQA